MERITDPDTIQQYLTDASNCEAGSADGIAFPDSEEEIISFIKECTKNGIPLTISGRGTGLTGARVPQSGWVLATDRLTQIKRIEQDPIGRDCYAVVQPGVLLQDFLESVSKSNLFYPPTPIRLSSLGGNVATNASGSRSFQYGSIRSFVKRLRVVLASGDVVEIKRGQHLAEDKECWELPTSSGVVKIPVPDYSMPHAKNAAGYFVGEDQDLIDLFIGSEGTLSIVTEIELKLLLKPAEEFAFVAFFEEAQQALAFAEEARGRSRYNRISRNDAGVSARAIEYFDEEALHLVRDQFPEIPEDARAAVYLEQECQPETEELLLDQWHVLFENHDSLLENLWAAYESEEIDRLTLFRQAVPLAVRDYLKEQGVRKVGTDFAIPEDSFEEMLEFQEELIEESGLRTVLFGHIGDCHLHLNFLAKNDKEVERALELYDELMRKAVTLGGTVSAEHGVGKLKRAHFAEMVGEDALKKMREIKESLDPNNLLGCGNLLPS